jgi:hypothetical protein
MISTPQLLYLTKLRERDSKKPLRCTRIGIGKLKPDSLMANIL